jgi:hypothetical protein
MAHCSKYNDSQEQRAVTCTFRGGHYATSNYVQGRLHDADWHHLEHVTASAPPGHTVSPLHLLSITDKYPLLETHTGSLHYWLRKHCLLA